jgi:chloramphenicol-sensitive protein RarD
MTDTPNQTGDTPAGFAFAVSAYLLWGGLPIYLKALEHVPPVEVTAHRILWSVPVAGLVLIALGRTSDILQALRSPRMLGMAAMTAAMISLNWSVYVWAIANDHALDAALGYYMNPLFSVALGAVVLREKLAPAQWAAVGLAVIAVAVLTVATGRLPLVALVLMGPQGHFLTTGISDTALLVGCGVVTAVPLMLYANGAKRLRLSTIGMLQYIAPTLIFLVAVFVFGEPFGTARAVAFPLIWLALVIYTAAMLREARAARTA